MKSEKNSENSYQYVLKSRYCRGSDMLYLLSERNKVYYWRQLWIWLAEAQLELGLKQVTPDAIQEMEESHEVFDWNLAYSEEKRLKHDVMAQIYTFGQICPKAKGIIHLGATSCFVQDNANLIIQRQCIGIVLNKLAKCLYRLGNLAETTKEIVTVGRTHLQPASFVTVGKRAVIWANEILMSFKKLEQFLKDMRFRGIKGATGTQDSFLTLFNGDEEKVEKLDELVAQKAGFKHLFLICGQTYSRQQDCDLMNAFALLGASLKKICLDIRFLQLMEPFESEQIGSSAMPYKRNPIKCERVCSLTRRLISIPQDMLNTFADQALERTLDDSAIRRVFIPEAFLITDAVLSTFQNVVEGLSLQMEVIERNVMQELPFLALEKALMWLTEAGCDRQVAHEKIRDVSLRMKETDKFIPICIESLLSDAFFDGVRDRVVHVAKRPLNFTGRCVSQTKKFLNEELYPSIKKYTVNCAFEPCKLDV